MNGSTDVDLALCVDCVMILCNDDDSGCREPERHREALAERWGSEPYRIVVTGEEYHFSRRPCDGCGDDDDGDRMEATAVAL